jgi:hypothetical protein
MSQSLEEKLRFFDLSCQFLLAEIAQITLGEGLAAPGLSNRRIFDFDTNFCDLLLQFVAAAFRAHRGLDIGRPHKCFEIMIAGCAIIGIHRHWVSHYFGKRWFSQALLDAVRSNLKPSCWGASDKPIILVV